MGNVCYKSWKFVMNNVIWHTYDHDVHFCIAIQKGLWTCSPYLVWRQITTLAKRCGETPNVNICIANVDVSFILLISNDGVNCPKFSQVTSCIPFNWLNSSTWFAIQTTVWKKNHIVLKNGQESTQARVSYEIMHYSHSILYMRSSK